MIKKEEVYCIGRLGKPHGVKGELSFMFTDDVFDRVDAEYIIVETCGILVPFFIEEYRFRSNETALLKLEGINTQEQARELTNCYVFFPHSLSDSDSDPTMAEIIGYKLIDAPSGEQIGEIRGIDDSTQNTLFLVTNEKGDSHLIPATDDFIVDINTKKREIKVSLPEGLLEL